MTCERCKKADPIALITVGGLPPQPVCRACGEETQRVAAANGTSVRIEEMAPEPMTYPTALLPWGE